jgi:hypothetical protein
MVGLPVSAQFGDFYGSSSDFFAIMQDPNTGLTVFPILMIPAGGEAESMGSAYTAVARDASFMEFNPAGSSVLENTELALLHNNWIADTNIEGILYTRRFDKLGFGLGGKFLYVPFTGYDMWGGRTASGYYSETVVAANVSYNFLSNYYFYGLAVGTTLKMAYRHVPEAIAVGQSAFGIMGDIGLLTRFNFLKFFAARNRNASVGLTLRNLGPAAAGEPLPSSVVLGLAYSPMRPWLVAFDIIVPVSLYPDKYPAEKPGFALGTSVQVTNFFSTQFGLLIRGGNPRLSLGGKLSVDMFTFVINYTLDMTTQFTNLDRFSVQLKVNFGDEGRKEREKAVEDYYLQGIEAYAKGNIQKSIELFSQALALDPTFLPAQETLDTAKRSLDLQVQMDATNKIE